MKVLGHFWPTCAVILGVWESASFVTKVPSVTSTARMIRRHPAGKLVIWLWIMGLARHLLLSQPKEIA